MSKRAGDSISSSLFLLQKWCKQKQNDNKIIKNYEIFDENSFF